MITELRLLRSIRSRLQIAINCLSIPLKEEESFETKKDSIQVATYQKDSLITLKKDFAKVNRRILEILTGDTRLKDLYQWTTSVLGIGQVTACEILITTNEFKNFHSAKKFACYCGVVPFEYSSGTSIRSKGKISGKANRRMKRLLHISSLTCLRGKNELSDFYKRNIEKGKSKMSALNSLRNKLIRRVFACVRDQRMYTPAPPVRQKTPI